MTDVIEAIERRRAELAPLVREFHRLEAAAAALDRVCDETATNKRGRPRGVGSSSAARRPAGRGRTPDDGKGAVGHRRRSGGRREALLADISAHPGTTIGESAARMGLSKATYLYVLAQQLLEDRKVRRDGGRWYARARRPSASGKKP